MQATQAAQSVFTPESPSGIRRQLSPIVLPRDEQQCVTVNARVCATAVPSFLAVLLRAFSVSAA